MISSRVYDRKIEPKDRKYFFLGKNRDRIEGNVPYSINLKFETI
ncbi:hypothetical protein LSS_13474 [Leptospira santarosai serovar Shermani str. LT 821]|uniref:Uncharacterized protein n=1 Tax=Leptospira santarosai serovar Shermani str. LT 821 TaxID=758847 RepID=K8Y6E3_9LEPT|nr:hypothetical protein LSS_13474 [Leptospira santarosai serovar Shermani str. LT 821]